MGQNQDLCEPSRLANKDRGFTITTGWLAGLTQGYALESMINTVTAPVSTFRWSCLLGAALAKDWGEPRLARKSALMSTAHPVADSGDRLAGDPIDRTYLCTLHHGQLGGRA
jgi:hypothetical protein